MPYLAIFFYAFTLWLGAYLLARRSPHIPVRLTGWGLLAYALALAVQVAFGQAPQFILLAPPLLWLGAALHLLPEALPARPALVRLWAVGAIPLAILAQLNAWFGGLALLALLLCAGLIARQALSERQSWPNPEHPKHSLALDERRSRPNPEHPKHSLALLAVLALFVGLSSGLVILPLNWLPPAWGMALLGCDLVLLGIIIIAWDAFDEGASIRRHLARSFVAALYYAGSLALISALFGRAAPGFPVGLALALVTFGVLTQAFSDPIQAGLDRLTLPSPVSAERQALRQETEALPLTSTWRPGLALSSSPDKTPGSLPDTPTQPVTLPDEEQFARWTRRALSNLGDLPRLAASPLIQLPMVQGSTPLERARSLNMLLAAHIQALKPPPDPNAALGTAEFGASDAWRYYNALYFPYVRGLKPYTRRFEDAQLAPIERAALDWFQASVPERTLHNWQNTAARLIADQLRREMQEQG